VEFRTNHEPYMVHGVVQGLPSPLTDCFVIAGKGGRGGRIPKL
jgi:hypothetical protein